jgi:hypothetical protein
MNLVSAQSLCYQWSTIRVSMTHGVQARAAKELEAVSWIVLPCCVDLSILHHNSTIKHQLDIILKCLIMLHTIEESDQLVAFVQKYAEQGRWQWSSQETNICEPCNSGISIWNYYRGLSTFPEASWLYEFSPLHLLPPEIAVKLPTFQNYPPSPLSSQGSREGQEHPWPLIFPPMPLLLG